MTYLLNRDTTFEGNNTFDRTVFGLNEQKDLAKVEATVPMNGYRRNDLMKGCV